MRNFLNKTTNGDSLRRSRRTHGLRRMRKRRRTIAEAQKEINKVRLSILNYKLYLTFTRIKRSIKKG